MSLKMSRTDHIDLGDFIVLWKGGNDDFRAISYDDMLKKLKEDLRQSATSNQYVSLVDDATIDFSIDSINTWVKVIESLPSKTLTINMPLPSYAVDGQEVIITNQSINVVALVFNLFGATMAWAIPSINSGSSYTLKYDKVMNSWYRVT